MEDPFDQFLTVPRIRDVMTKHPLNSNPCPQESFLARAIQEQEISCFVLASTLDVLMTYILLRQPELQFIESNPIANFFLTNWDVTGLACFKLSMTAVVCIIAHFVAKYRPNVAQRLLNSATLVILAVVFYRSYLLVRHLP